MSDLFTYKIRQQYKSLRQSEQKVADALLNESFDIMNSTITDLAEFADVSQPTIIRFANAIGLKGFKDIKTTLIMERKIIEPEKDMTSFEISNKDRLIDIPYKVINTQIKHLEDMLKNLSSYEISKAIKSIVEADSIIIFGVENSTSIAIDLKTKLMYMGFNVIYETDPYLQIVSGKKITNKDVAIGISYTGTSKVTIDALYQAKKNNATTITITNFEDAIINKYANIILSAGNQQYLYGNTIFSRCTQIAIVEMLYIGILNMDYEKYSKNLKENGQEVSIFEYKE